MPVDIEYKGGLQFDVNCHGHRCTVGVPEGGETSTEMPTPTECFVSSLGACIGVYVADYCNRVGIPTEGMRIEVDWDVVGKPKRVGAVRAKVHLPHPVSPERQRAIQRVADQCLVKNSTKQTPQFDLAIETPE